MQAMLRASVQKVGGIHRPLRFAKKRCLALIEVSAEMTSKVSAGASRPQQLSCARPVQPGAMTNECLRKSRVVAFESHHKIGESTRNVPTRKRRAGGPVARHPGKPGDEAPQRVLGELAIGGDLAAKDREQ